MLCKIHYLDERVQEAWSLGCPPPGGEIAPAGSGRAKLGLRNIAESAMVRTSQSVVDPSHTPTRPRPAWMASSQVAARRTKTPPTKLTPRACRVLPAPRSD